jgi:hypothetical protein
VDLNDLEVTARHDYRPAPQVDLSAVKPSLAVSNAAVGRRIGELQAQLTHAEREAAATGFNPNGYMSEYVVNRRRAAAEHMAALRDEIAALQALTPDECVEWAYARGVR